MRFCGMCGAKLADSESPASALPGLSSAPQQLGAMMGADLLERFRQAGLEAAGQRRNVTVLFTDLTNYTLLSEELEPDEVYDLIQQYSRLLANNVYKYEGIVDKFTGDGLMALFGAPIARENNAELAVRAALDMQADIVKLSQTFKARLGRDLQIRVGLNHGPVVVGGVGSDMMMNYTAIGNTVNLASRLEHAAENGAILVSETVYRQTQALFDFQPTAPLTLKGVSHPIVGYSVTGLKAKPGSLRGVEGLRAPLIGRAAELQRLRQTLGNLVDRQQGQFILVTGEAGIGKSRLTAEFKTLARQTRRVRILEGQSLTYRRGVPYWIFLDLLRDYFGLTADLTKAQMRERMRQKAASVLGLGTAEALPYLEYLLGITPSFSPATERLRYLEPGQLRQQIFRVVRSLLEGEARQQPVLLILEDLHWADETSLDLLAFLLESLKQAPLGLYAVSRPLPEGALTKIVEQAHKRLPHQVTTLQLQNLAPEQSQQLLRELLGLPDLPETLREHILRRAAGIPLYLEEILRMLIDDHVIQHLEGRWQFTKARSSQVFGVPDTLQDLILARFDRLGPAERRVLQIAAVIGRQFNPAIVSAVLQPSEVAELPALLAALVQREFILPPAENISDHYEFKNVLVSDSIYGTLLKRDRNDLHGQVGAALETVYADQLDSQVEVLARHFVWSPYLDRALHYLILAGQKAARGYANEQARQYFEQALNLLSQIEYTAEQALNVRTGLGDVLALVGRYAAAREHYQTALDELAESPEYLRHRLALERKIAATFERQGEFEQVLVRLTAAQAALQHAPQAMEIERAQIVSDLGWVHFLRGNLDEAEKLLNESAQLIKGSDRYDIAAAIYNRLGGVHFQKGDLDLAAERVRQSLAQRKAMGDTAGVGRSYNNLGLLQWRLGDYDSALQSFQTAQEYLTPIGDAEALAFTYTNIGLLNIDRGELAEALTALNHSLEAVQRIGHPLEIARVHIHLARVHLYRQDLEQARASLDESLRLCRELGSQENLIEVYHLLGEWSIEAGALDHAESWARQGLDLLPTSNSGTKGLSLSGQRGRLLRLLGTVATQRNQFEQAEQYFRESRAIFTALKDQPELGRTAYQAALLVLRQGNPAEARAQLQHSHDIFQELGAKVELKRVAETLHQLQD